MIIILLLLLLLHVSNICNISRDIKNKYIFNLIQRINSRIRGAKTLLKLLNGVYIRERFNFILV
jgi:hypothetical protein